MKEKKDIVRTDGCTSKRESNAPQNWGERDQERERENSKTKKTKKTNQIRFGKHNFCYNWIVRICRLNVM